MNVLADLAADVLPVEEARAVEAHVMECPDCAGLLADAERVRPLLLSDEVGPMPAEVWSRLSGALAQESAARSAAQGPPVPMSPVPAPTSVPWDQRWQGADPQTWGETTAEWSLREAGWARSPLEAGDQEGGAAPAPGTRGANGSPQDPRWEATEAWDSLDLRDAPARPPRLDSPAGGPADPAGSAADAVPGTRPGTEATTPQGTDPADDATGYTRMIRPVADLSPSAPAERSTESTSTLPAVGPSRLSAVRRPGRPGGPTRRDVRDSKRSDSRRSESASGDDRVAGRLLAGRRAPLLAAAAGVLVAAGLGGFAWSALDGDSNQAARNGAAAALPSVSAPVLQSGRDYSTESLGTLAPTLAKEATARRPSVGTSLSTTAAGSSPLARPDVLKRCLDQLDAGDQTPLAVDLATYQNREAAIILLRGEDGGYEVWAVSRDCGSGDESALQFVAVPKS